LSRDITEKICARGYGLGSDGILLREKPSQRAAFRVRFLNPDGSEAEKSGNGLRIFSRYLWDRQEVADAAFEVETAGGLVQCRVSHEGRIVTVEMGKVTFHSHDIPVTGPPRDVLDETMYVDGQEIRFSAAGIGNPHCVVFRTELREEETRKLGPLIETETLFPNLTNVQFAQVLDRANVRIQIWERGVGYTTASGTSSCAVAAVAKRLGLCDGSVTVHMPGGKIEVHISGDYQVRMTGPVVRVAEGELSPELFASTGI
jgi:diaminopimelate epimerase